MTFWIYVHMFPSALMDTFTQKTASLVAVLISDAHLIKHTNTEIKFATKKHKEGRSHLLCITNILYETHSARQSASCFVSIPASPLLQHSASWSASR